MADTMQAGLGDESAFQQRVAETRRRIAEKELRLLVKKEGRLDQQLSGGIDGPVSILPGKQNPLEGAAEGLAAALRLPVTPLAAVAAGLFTVKSALDALGEAEAGRRSREMSASEAAAGVGVKSERAQQFLRSGVANSRGVPVATAEEVREIAGAYSGSLASGMGLARDPQQREADLEAAYGLTAQGYTPAQVKTMVANPLFAAGVRDPLILSNGKFSGPGQTKQGAAARAATVAEITQIDLAAMAPPSAEEQTMGQWNAWQRARHAEGHSPLWTSPAKYIGAAVEITAGSLNHTLGEVNRVARELSPGDFAVFDRISRMADDISMHRKAAERTANNTSTVPSPTPK